MSAAALPARTAALLFMKWMVISTALPVRGLLRARNEQSTMAATNERAIGAMQKLRASVLCAAWGTDHERQIRAAPAAMARRRTAQAQNLGGERDGAEGDRQSPHPQRGIGEAAREGRRSQNREIALSEVAMADFPDDIFTEP